MSSETLHVVSLPHTQTTEKYATCAYTQKVRKFCKMMTGHGRRVVLYSGEENDAICDEHVPCMTEERRQSFFGPPDESDLDRGGFAWDPRLPYWTEFNARVAGEVSARAQSTDLLCLSQGQSQQVVADVNPALTIAEFGVGYEGFINAPGTRQHAGHVYCAFESLAFQHLVYGRWGMQNMMNERWFDAVIPNYFDPDEFKLDRAAKRRITTAKRGDYLLFVGRLINLKGPHVAARIADELGMKLVVAGPGEVGRGPGFVQAAEVRVEARDLEFVGPVGIRERAELMTGAQAFLAPTMYVEPFGGVAVEAMMCGTPAVTSPWGAFTETVLPGVSGYRFNTLREGVEAVVKARDLDRSAVKDYALARYSIDAVRPLYLEWFDRLDTLWAGGWDYLPR